MLAALGINGTMIAIGLGVLAAIFITGAIVVRRWKKAAYKSGQDDMARDIQNKELDNAQVRNRIEAETRDRPRVEIARDIGADGTGELR